MIASKTSSVVWSTATSAPRSRHSWALSAPPAIAITRAPAATASWMAAVPTALAPPRTTTVSPAWSAGALVQREVADVEGQRERRGLGVVELGRCVEEGPGESVLGQAAERLRADADDAATEPLLGAVAGGLDHAGDVHAERERRLRHHRGDPAPAAGDVAEVERGGRDGDPDLAGGRIGDLDVVADLDRAGRFSVLQDANGPHVTPITLDEADGTKRAF